MPESPIRIEVDRSGGFANRSVHAALDTSTLPADQATEIGELVDRVDFAALARRQGRPGSAPGADRFQYDLTVQRGGARHRLSLPESAVPAELKQLLNRVMAHGKAHTGDG